VRGRRAGIRVAAAAAAALACRGAPEEEHREEAPPAAVTCEVALAGDVEEVVEVVGQIAPPPAADAILSSPVAGRVGQVTVEEGDRVKAGALLAIVEDPALPAGTIEARAQVASAQAAREAADLELARQTRLVGAGIGARRELDEARTKAATTTAELDAARAREGLANRQLARRELRAPRGGIVLHLWRRAGESVDGTSATPIVEIADLAVLELRAQVPPRALMALREGQAAAVSAAGVDAPIAAKVARVAPAVDPATLLGTVRVELAGAARLPVGSAATARIVVGTHRGLAVPAQALRRSLTGADELVVCDGATARVRAVTVGQRGTTVVEIAQGLADGERIVVDHVLGLEEGQALAPAARGSAGPR
jgi:RND family efflux transporter MFP subunit